MLLDTGYPRMGIRALVEESMGGRGAGNSLKESMGMGEGGTLRPPSADPPPTLRPSGTGAPPAFHLSSAALPRAEMNEFYPLARCEFHFLSVGLPGIRSLHILFYSFYFIYGGCESQGTHTPLHR